MNRQRRTVCHRLGLGVSFAIVAALASSARVAPAEESNVLVVASVDSFRDAYLSQEGNEISGEVIKYDIVAGKVDAQSDSSGPVRMVLQPASRKNKPAETQPE